MVASHNSCLLKQQIVKELFSSCVDQEEKYEKIIALGRKLSAIAPDERVEGNIVRGCQSTVYLASHLREGHIYFAVEADALISAGLASLLIEVYSGEDPEVVLTCAPTYLDELGVSSSLTPSRTNGLYNIHLRMKQDALKALLRN